MSRALSPANAAAISEDQVRLGAFFEGVFPDGIVRIWTGSQSISWGGHTWTGAGALLATSAVEETNDVVATGITVSLSGVPLDLISLAISSVRQGAPGRLWLGFFDPDWALLADPELVFAGLLDVPTISEDGETATISVTYESQLIDLQRPREWRYTHESQQQFFAGDRGFEYITSIQDLDLKWGR